MGKDEKRVVEAYFKIIWRHLFKRTE